MSDAIKVRSSALPDGTRVGGFRCTEGISRLYEVDLYLVLAGDAQDLDLSDVINAKGTLEIDPLDGKPPFVFHGIFAAFELMHHYGTYSIFRATLVPQLWLLTQTFHSRIWTHKSITTILQEVLEDGGLSGSDYTLKLVQTYKSEEHVCQYMESNFDFISRWMEREGMYYYFEQGDEGERLVITDDKSLHGPLGDEPVRFHTIVGRDVSSEQAMHSYTCKHRSLPANVKYKDYDYAKPTLDVSGSAPVSKQGTGEISVYGARFFSPDDGRRIARLRAEELLAREVVYTGKGNALYLRPGYLFTLEDHPRSAFDMKYLVIEAEHTGALALPVAEIRRLSGIEVSEGYAVEIKAIPATVQFRAESRTPWPRIYGYENGVVCGPIESEYAQIDEQGRYNVKLKFDESELKDGKASTFVRMAQPHGGSPEGFHFPLRKGTEVLFTFLGGDPDRPVIAAVVPNTHTPSPVTKGNHTLNVIQTGGRNRFELDDKHGQQRVTLSTPYSNSYMRMGSPNDGHEFIIHTDEHCLLKAGSDWDVKIGGHLAEDVTGPVYEEYHATRETEVHGDTDEKWDATLTQTVTGVTTQTYNADHQIKSSATRTDHVVGVLTQKYDAPVAQTLGATLEEHIASDTQRTIGGVLLDTVSGTHTLTTGARTDTINGTLTQTASGAITITAPSITQHATGPQSFITNSTKASMTYGLTFSADLSASLSLFAGIKLSAEASIKISATVGLKADFGSAINLRSAPTEVTLGAAITTITGGAMIDIVSPCVFVPAASIVLL